MTSNFARDHFIQTLADEEEVFWTNPYKTSYQGIALPSDSINEAHLRIKRFAPYLKIAFPELQKTNGQIQSPIKILRTYQKANKIPGNVLLKMDNELPISGSIKARGGFYEVLKHAESLAADHGLLKDDNYHLLVEKKDFFSQYSISVGSTGNLGLSIGLMGSKLGFTVQVHMSKDAWQWKKELLRKHNVTVYEYDDDYSFAVESARKKSLNNPKDFFIDDENSKDLFIGYSTAALELAAQLKEINITINHKNPLFVYLPCGVGGGPGGITFGLKEVFGDHVHCFFAEPTQSPSVLLGFYTQLHEKVSVRDIGLNNNTIADGLAVGKPSGLVGRLLNEVVDGFYTAKDDYLKEKIKELYDLEHTFLEPSAAIGCKGIDMALHHSEYISQQNIQKENIIHLIWGTGGSLVPEDIKKEYLR